VGHEVKLINFSAPGKPLRLDIQGFAHSNTFDQAFVSGIHGLNRPTNVRMGPDGCAWVVDYAQCATTGRLVPTASSSAPPTVRWCRYQAQV
jgi:hypothetical protein